MSIDYTLNPPLAIDLGTTYSVIAKWNGRAAEHYKTGKVGSKSTFQSVVWYDEKNDKYLSDEIAYKKTIVDPDHGIIGVKRYMDDREKVIKLGNKSHSPMEISAKIIEGMYNRVAGMYTTGQFKSKKVVVTVPYYFKAHQCANTREAVELAGLECAGILQEPIAASLQYVLQVLEENPKAEMDEVMLVFDLGGGTFDLTLFNLRISNKKLVFEVLASGGDDRLGGLDFDSALANYILEKEDISLDLEESRADRISWQKLLAACVDLKETLSVTEKDDLIIPLFNAEKHIEREVTREEFESCISDYLGKIAQHIDAIFQKSGIKKQDVSRVIKVGGSSKIPAMHKLLQDHVDNHIIFSNIDDALCVAEGAAIYAAYLDDPETIGREIEITNRSPHALGIEIDGGAFYELIPANCKTPCARSQIFVPTNGQRAINVNVYQGSANHVKSNSKIGTMPIDIPVDLEETDIKVKFSQDEEQYLTVRIKVGRKEYMEGFRTT